jgi:hypothetical protein
MNAAILLALAFASVQNGYESKRGLACMAVLWVTAASIIAYHSELYFTLENIFGLYGYLSLAPIISICILAKIKCRLSTCLMVLFCVLISVNIIAWYVEGLGVVVEVFHERVVWVLFVVQMLLMLSRKLTDGVHRVICRPSVARDTSAPIVAFEHLDYRTESNTGEDSK